MHQFLISDIGSPQIERGAELLRVNRVVRKHIVMAGDGELRLDLSAHFSRLPMREVVESAVDHRDDDIGLVLLGRKEQFTKIGVTGDVDSRTTGELKEETHVVEIGVV